MWRVGGGCGRRNNQYPNIAHLLDQGFGGGGGGGGEGSYKC